MQYSNLTIVKIGKNGLTSELKKHILILLKQHKILKIKFLSKENFTEEGLPGKILKKIGRTIIIKK